MSSIVVNHHPDAMFFWISDLIKVYGNNFYLRESTRNPNCFNAWGTFSDHHLCGTWISETEVGRVFDRRKKTTDVTVERRKR